MSKEPVISLIVAIRNEEQVICDLLDSINPQESDEIILVLDRCTDSTEAIIRSHQMAHRFNLVVLRETAWPEAPKKYAILQGIHHANGEILLFTDADCILPSNFFHSWRSCFSSGDIGVGFSLPIPTVTKENLSIGQLLQVIDAGVTAVLYRYFTQIGLPYMAVGRNWGFRKALFRDEFLGNHRTIKSGDDDLLFQQLARIKNVRVVVNEELNVLTVLQRTLPDLIRQKLRHYRTGLKYPILIQLTLPFFQVWWVPLALITLVFSLFISGLFVGLAGVVYMVITYTWIKKILNLYAKITKTVIPVNQFIWGIPLYFFIYPLFSVFSYLVPQKWK